ncbi:glycosyltransferase [Ornithinibacillus gellani]|uniref:glycosyltransferase n=1 Tax=Ornithinibacillus gellani TaxID=2293253 RepID=UPI000F492524|nr:glycosyltransferase [Ornithinibacillus gellani]TQS74121.1 glycosyltransferase [Ornithinibacillus gellani]
MKQKILFMIIDMNIGGTEKALLNMIAEMPADQFEITILMLEKRGGLMGFIPDHVQVEVLEGYADVKEAWNHPPLQTSISLVKRRKLLKAAGFMLTYMLGRVTRNKRVFFNWLLKDIPGQQIVYDTAVAYAGPMDFISYFIAYKITAKKKLQWIHFDVTKIGFDQSFAKRNYPSFDRIFTVSNEGKEKLLQLMPSLHEKVTVCTNRLSSEQIINQAEQEICMADGFSGTTILTVGRLSEEKGQDLAIQAMVKLLEMGHNVRWYCVGEGPFRGYCETLIERYSLKSKFFLLGALANPYPFMKACDIYVQPSRHEGYCITLAEAKVFHKPIVTTNFTGAKEQIIDGRTGIIVEPDVNSISTAIHSLLEEPEKRKRLTRHLCEEEVIAAKQQSSNIIGVFT